jgi:hypothetical protein
LKNTDYTRLREGVLVSFRQISLPAGGDEGKNKPSGMQEVHSSMEIDPALSANNGTYIQK